MILAAFLIGFSKTGIGGMLMLVIPILADAFGGMQSTGSSCRYSLWAICLRWEITAGISIGENIRKLMIWTVIGLALGLVIGKFINDSQFKITIAIMVLICLMILIYTERKGDRLNVPKKMWFYALTGILAGFATMIGNAAGPIFTIYLFPWDLRKTNTWAPTPFSFYGQRRQVPLQVFVWHNITAHHVLLTGCMVPFVALGALLGLL